MKTIFGKRKSIMILSFAVMMTLTGCNAPVADDDPKPAQETVYNGFFNADTVHEINVEISEEDWKDLRENPLDKSKYEVTVTIDGETFEQVSFSTKGNSSLHVVAEDESDRYSFKLNFSKYIKDQTYYGLNQMKLSNLFDDPSGMEDYLSYRIVAEAGGYTPLAGYAWLKINGEDCGLYLAVEEINKSWIARTQESKGALYKPDAEWTSLSVEIPGMTFSTDIFLEYMKAARKYYGDSDLGAGLLYTDDRIESYPAIFDNAETDVTEEDQMRLIQSLKVLNSNENPSSVLNTDEILGYFAGHNFTMNYDSYIGLLGHNYYLYEENGVLSAVAWDYNESFGGMLAMIHPELSVTDIVNWGIDTPLSDTDLSQRPLWAWVVNDEANLDGYHAAMDRLISSYFESGQFEKEITAVHDLLQPYIAKDPTFFYTMEEFESSYASLKAFCLKRAESIRRQLNGELSADNEQQTDSAKVDARDVMIP